MIARLNSPRARMGNKALEVGVDRRRGSPSQDEGIVGPNASSDARLDALRKPCHARPYLAGGPWPNAIPHADRFFLMPWFMRIKRGAPRPRRGAGDRKASHN